MMTATIILTLSLVGIIAVLVNKMQHLNKGKAFVSVNVTTDARVKKISVDTALIIKNAPKVIAHTAAFLALRYGIKLYEKGKKKIYPKISHLVDAVKGRDIPKTRGSASSYLSSIGKDTETRE